MMNSNPATDPRDVQPEDPYGPSDSSDSASDRPAGTPDTDAAGTGERASAAPPFREDNADRPADVSPDKQVDADGAGVSRSPPDPVRNGGVER
ncbi:MAG: hypothetical protein M0R28_19990 [Pigmentiphaga sp.]|nr:hypothetical protein [Pigmentiphaga sp.]